MATHSSVLAWRIPGTEEPGGLPSMGSHRVRHDWSDLAAAASLIWIFSEILWGRSRSIYFFQSTFIFKQGNNFQGIDCIYSVLSVLIGGTSGKELAAGDVRVEALIPGSGRSPGGRHGNPLQYSCLENPMDRGAWWATVRRVAKNWTQMKCLSMHIQLYQHPSPFLKMENTANRKGLPRCLQAWWVTQTSASSCSNAI